MSRCCPTLALVLLSWLSFCQAQGIPPAPRDYILDEPGLLSAQTKETLFQLLERYERDTSNEVVVAILKELPANTFLEDYTVRIGHAWGLGTKERDNGVILFVFAKDAEGKRRSRIEVGYGLEGVLPDSVADRLLREVLNPALSAGKYDEGIEGTVRVLLKIAEKEYQAKHKSSGLSTDTTLWFIVALFFAFAIWVHVGDTVFQRAGRFFLWQLFDIIRILLVLGAGGGGRREDSRGGGGDFGGGGASGSW